MSFISIFLVICTILLNFHLINGQLLTGFNLPKLKFHQQQQQLLTLKDSALEPRLILTPYIEAEQISLARKLSKVNKELFLNVTSFSGYLTVDNVNDGNLFFWFFPAEGTESLYEDFDDYDGEDEDTDFDHKFLKKLVKRRKTSNSDDLRSINDNKPIILWLQGGPGTSSLFGLFTENGPFLINDNLKSIRENPYSWHKNYSVLFIDNPVGTGFSFTNPDGYVQNMTQVGKHMYRALSQFFDLFPNLKKNDFFITGESFAGKYIPAIANEIYEQNNITYDEDKKINLKGLALGNAFSDPYNMHEYADFAYQLGLVGDQGYEEMKIYQLLLKLNFNSPVKAKSYWDFILYSFLKSSFYQNLYNIQQPEVMNLFIFFDFVNQPEIRNAIHVGQQPFQDPTIVYTNLIMDFMNTAIHWTEKLLNQGLRIFYYNGNWDFIVAYPLSENSFKKMKWNGAEKYRHAPRLPFLIDGKLKGYIKKADNFYEATFLNAGHMVPTDQPLACLTVLDKFFKNEI